MSPSIVAALLTGLLLVGAAPAIAALPAGVDGQPLPSLAPMLERVTPAVVNISTQGRLQSDDLPLLRDPLFRWFFEDRRPRQRGTQSLGSGVVVDADNGLILTNHHVIEKADKIRVTLSDGREFDAELLGADPDTDIAVLQVAATDLTAIPLADSDRLRVGDFVVAIGNPFGLRQTVTSGIVSALGRTGLGIEGYEDFIQTDASINPGNSGGPLVNLRGELVGINTAILAPSGGNVGIGFAIPSNMADAISRQIVEYGGINRGTFGIAAQDLTPALAQALGIAARQSGAVVNDIEPNSAAAESGLQPGDVIVALGDRAVAGAADLETQLALRRIGDRIQLRVLRDGSQRTLKAQLADPYATYVDGASVAAILSGCRLKAVLDESGLGRLRGIAVGPVIEDSAAWERGLRKGDIIFEANRERVDTLDALGGIADNGLYQLRLRRGDRLITMVSR